MFPDLAVDRRLNAFHPNPNGQKPVLFTMFCQYYNGRIMKRWLPVSETHYITISHVWEDVSWRDIPGLPGQILASKAKAGSISERLTAPVGDDFFWMDILCAEQGDACFRIAVTQHIPTIFKSAIKTIVIKDGYGPRRCCIQAAGNIQQWFARADGCRQRLFDHYTSLH